MQTNGAKNLMKQNIIWMAKKSGCQYYKHPKLNDLFLIPTFLAQFSIIASLKLKKNNSLIVFRHVITWPHQINEFFFDWNILATWKTAYKKLDHENTIEIERGYLTFVQTMSCISASVSTFCEDESAGSAKYTFILKITNVSRS